MVQRKPLFLWMLLALSLPTALAAQSHKTQHTLTLDADAASPEASIGQIAWIAGNWHGEAFGGRVEEVWSEPLGKAMMGMFRLVNGDETGFYELMTLSEASGSLILRLKHFNADLTGWEEKMETVDFPLVRLEEGTAYFDGLTFKRVDERSLDIFLASENKEGGFDELVFHYKLK